MDDCFFHRTKLEEHQEEQDGIMPMLVAYDEGKDGLWALQVDRKGVAAELEKWCCDTLEDS